MQMKKNTKSKILQIQHSIGFSLHNLEDRTFRTGTDPITQKNFKKKNTGSHYKETIQKKATHDS